MDLDIEILKFVENKTFGRSKYEKRTFDDWNDYLENAYSRFRFRFIEISKFVESKTFGRSEKNKFDDEIIILDRNFGFDLRAI